MKRERDERVERDAIALLVEFGLRVGDYSLQDSDVAPQPLHLRRQRVSLGEEGTEVGRHGRVLVGVYGGHLGGGGLEAGDCFGGHASSC